MSDMLYDFCFVKFSVKFTHSLPRKGFLASGGKPKARFVFQTYTKKTLAMIFNCSKFIEIGSINGLDFNSGYTLGNNTQLLSINCVHIY